MVVALRYVVSEALTNAAKHARASHVAVCGQSKDDILWLDTIDFCRSSHRQAAAICCWSRLEVDVTLEIGSPLGFSRSTQRLIDALLKRLDALPHHIRTTCKCSAAASKLPNSISAANAQSASGFPSSASIRPTIGSSDSESGSDDVTVDSQSAWRMAMSLPGRLQNSHGNGGRVFLILVADPRTTRLCTTRLSCMAVSAADVRW